MHLKSALVIAALMSITPAFADVVKLTGTPLGSSPSVDYDKSGFPATTAVNTPDYAFDGNPDTYYASYGRSYTYVGLDLGERHVISRVGYCPRNAEIGPGRLQLGIIEGANSPDFLDAIPIHIITENNAPVGKITYRDVDCSRGFRYVRFVSTADNRCNIAELEFWGEKGDGDDSHLYQLTNIPTVVINTVNAEEPYDKEHNITAQIKIISDNGTKILDAEGTTRLRGNASMEFPKKPYRIKFDKKQNVLDAPAKAKKWTLINNYGDKTLLRNDLAFETARRLGMAYVPYLESVDVILNGEYKGNYQLCDQVEVNKGRVDVEEMETTDIAGEALTGGYLVEVDAYADREISWFRTTRGTPVTIKSPDEDDITPEQTSYIRNYFNELENLLWTSTAAGRNTYRDMFDIVSFLQHFLVGEISGNTDTYWSTYMYKRRGNPSFYTGPVWDFDIAFENDDRTYPINNIAGYLYASSKSSEAQNMRNFVTRIIQNDRETKGNIRYIWDMAGYNDDLSAKGLIEYFEARAERIDASQKLNFLRWPILNTCVHQNPRAEGSYEKEVQRVTGYVAKRFEHLDAIIRQYPTTPVSGVEAPSYTQGSILGYGGEVALAGFGQGSVYEVFDTMGRKIAGGEFDRSAEFTLPACAMYIVRTVDGTSGSTQSKKFAF
ncbi:MAG: hypothetical protein HDS65_01055 [Bacteroidales bacterium]|nr:hypothetical protein [Bacteroidales bacterium]